MTDVEQIEREIEGLSSEDLGRFRAWFLEFDARIWDRQIEADSKSGRMDDLIAEARADYEAGKAREL